MSLPPLPAPFRKQGQQMAYDGYDKVFFDCYSSDQMQAYGQQCRETALEEAAKVCQSQADQLMYPSTGNAIALVCAGKIRSMK